MQWQDNGVERLNMEGIMQEVSKRTMSCNAAYDHAHAMAFSKGVTTKIEWKSCNDEDSMQHGGSPIDTLCE